MLALTSLTLNPLRAPAQHEALASWEAAGLRAQSLNHPAEIEALAPNYTGVELIPCEPTTFARFGRYCISVNALLAQLATTPGQGVLINSDIVLRFTPAQMAHFAEQCRDGLGYLVKYNHDGDESRGVREPYGIDAFVFDPRVVQLGQSCLSMGQPVWDYWLPYEFLRTGRKLYATDEPVA